MSVLKIKKNGVWESVSGASGHTHTKDDIIDFPDNLPTDGGNADTVDGKHASEFATADHTHEQINVLTSLVGDTDVSTQIADAIVDKAEKDHTHGNATETTSGFMSFADKEKLDAIDEGANRIVVDSVLNDTSTNPVQNAVITAALNEKEGVGHKHTLDDISETVDKKIMTLAEREKLDEIADGANKTVVDTSLSLTSTNPVENKAVYTAINELSSRIGDTDVSMQIADAIADKADADHTHNNATTTTSGFMSASDKIKLDELSAGGGQITIDTSLSATSTNPVQNKVLYKEIESLHTAISDIDVSSQIEDAISGKAESSHEHSASDITSGTLNSNRLPTVPITKGGTGATTAEAALTNLGVTTYVSDAISDVQSELSGKADAEHTHSEYASSSHTHSNYAASNHTHTGYASSSHEHTNYALSEHAHSTSDIDGLRDYVKKDGSSLNEVTDTNGHAEGYDTSSTGAAAHTEGWTTTASGQAAHAEGMSTIASGVQSHAEGLSTQATGAYSHTGGFGTIAKGNCAFAHGNNVTASANQFFCGKYYITPLPNGVADSSQTGGNILFAVGNGTSTSATSVAFAVDAAGNCLNKTGVYNQSADFAEFFEWSDGNPDNLDRRGLLVTLDGEKIRPACTEDDVLGVISGTAAFIGNSACMEWNNRYVKDVFGTLVTQEVEIPEAVDETTGEIIPAHSVEQFVINPDYDPNQEYISRENRPEWDPVGMLGQVVVVDDGTCVVNGYCAPSVDGIGTASDNGYRVMKRIDDTHIKVLVK